MTKNSIGNKYSQELYAKTKFYQKKYGFKLDSYDGDTHNNEADAFKHTFGAAEIALKTWSGMSKGITDFHELQQKTTLYMKKIWINGIIMKVEKLLKK